MPALPAASKLDGPRAKVELAGERATELLEECRLWSAAQAPTIERRITSDGWYEWFMPASTVPAPPARLSVLAGELIYSLRSALDQAAWTLVEANGNQPSTKNTYFPIARKDDNQWLSMKGSYLRGMASAAVETIKQWQPIYLTPEHPNANALAILDELGLVDKHRLMYSTAAPILDYNLFVSGESPHKRWRIIERKLRNVSDVLKLDQDEWICRARVLHADGSDRVDISMPLNLDAKKIRLGVAFNATTATGGVITAPVHTFALLVDHVTALLNDLEQHL